MLHVLLVASAGVSFATDTDNDGICDTESDTDPSCVAIPGGDLNPNDPYVCMDQDLDGCDDCSKGVDGTGPMPDYDANRDGPDPNGDGECNTDSDGDGVADVDDPVPNDPFVCGNVPYEDGIRASGAPDDRDGDGCDDCSLTGPDGSGGDRFNDGFDSNGDGVCDVTLVDTDGDGLFDPQDDDDDNDGYLDAVDNCPAGEVDWDTSADDYDSDGCKDSTEDNDDDGDGVPDSGDFCATGTLGWTSTAQTDNDGDGCHDVDEDNDDDNDGVLDANDPLPREPTVCGDQNGNGQDDCQEEPSSGCMSARSHVLPLVLGVLVLMLSGLRRMRLYSVRR